MDGEEYPHRIINPKGIEFMRKEDGQYVSRSSSGRQRILETWIVNCLVAGAVVEGYRATYHGKPIGFDRGVRRQPQLRELMFGTE